jgi:hypothetical protein
MSRAPPLVRLDRLLHTTVILIVATTTVKTTVQRARISEELAAHRCCAA